MKNLSFALVGLLMLLSVSLKAQKKAVQDNGTIAVVQSQTTVGRNQQTHYKMTNNGTVSMDFSLYKQMKNGSWDVVHHLDLAPGQTYEDVNSFSGYNGKYALFSAPHSDWASFPNAIDIAGLINNQGTSAAAATPAPAVESTPAPAAKPSTPSSAKSQSSNNTQPAPLPPI
ncbi:MAG TPA: hypothetical protein VFE54_12335 [Mucilaginibacter sp.]|nr:hypothetical protein [Mucilaginibacter sp.]